MPEVWHGKGNGGNYRVQSWNDDGDHFTLTDEAGSKDTCHPEPVASADLCEQKKFGRNKRCVSVFFIKIGLPHKHVQGRG